MPDDKADASKDGRGRSEKRREAKTFDALALELLALPSHRCRGLPIEGELRETFNLARTTTSKAARRRLIRRLSGLLRNSEDDVTAIRSFLDGATHVPIARDSETPELVEMRERLCSPDQFESAMDEVFAKYPDVDTQLVRMLAQSCHPDRDEKAYRRLFKELRRAADLAAADE